jgi:type VI secretion system secreted protein Hcp
MAYDAFLFFADTIVGETLDKTYADKKAMQIYSFSWGESNPTTVGHGQGLSAGKVSLTSLNLMKRVDSASPDLALCCANGQTLSKATLVLRKASKEALVYLEIELTDVMVESIQWSGSVGGDDYPSESISLAYAAIKIGYTPQKIDGTPGTTKDFKWNLTTNVSA